MVAATHARNTRVCRTLLTRLTPHAASHTRGHTLRAQVTPTLALYDTMQYVRSPTATVCYGMCLGMGGFLLTAGGEKVRTCCGALLALLVARWLGACGGTLHSPHARAVAGMLLRSATRHPCTRRHRHRQHHQHTPPTPPTPTTPPNPRTPGLPLLHAAQHPYAAPPQRRQQGAGERDAHREPGARARARLPVPHHQRQHGAALRQGACAGDGGWAPGSWCAGSGCGGCSTSAAPCAPAHPPTPSRTTPTHRSSASCHATSGWTPRKQWSTEPSTRC